jgi:WhiB family transcriptional regulator, redox-sensing transcriptional regulator
MSARSNLPSYLQMPKFILDGTPACSNVDPELFYPQEIEVNKTKVISKYTNLAAAKKICSECPLKLKCLEYALNNGEIGVWGGTTEHQRDDLRGRRRISRPITIE